MKYEQISHDPRSVRHGLAESLEDYAKRQGMTIRDARWFWRADGVHLLSGKVEDAEHVAYDGRMLRPRDVIEVE
jgi:hypothetical protein